MNDEHIILGLTPRTSPQCVSSMCTDMVCAVFMGGGWSDGASGLADHRTSEAETAGGRGPGRPPGKRILGRTGEGAGCMVVFFFFQAEDGIRDLTVTGVQTCALPISRCGGRARPAETARPPHRALPGRDRAPRLDALPRLLHAAALVHQDGRPVPARLQIGRASCRERV